MTPDDAKRVLDAIRGRIAEGRAGLPPAESTATIRELAPEWLMRRDASHRSAQEDRRRWRLNIEPFFGGMTPSSVSVVDVERFIANRRAHGLAPGTIGVCLHVLSAFFSDLMRRKPLPLAASNPCRELSKEQQRLVKSEIHPEDVPFVEKLADVRRIFLALPEPVSIAYAIGAMAGLRTGEILALRWEAVDMERRALRVKVSAVKDTCEERAPKSGKRREVPILDSLYPVLQAWKLKTGGRGLVIPPLTTTCRGPPRRTSLGNRCGRRCAPRSRRWASPRKRGRPARPGRSRGTGRRGTPSRRSGSWPTGAWRSSPRSSATPA